MRGETVYSLFKVRKSLANKMNELEEKRKGGN